MKRKTVKIFWLVFLALIFFRATAALAFSSGEKVNFYIDASYDVQGRSKISATLRLVSDKALFYVDDDWWAKLADYNLTNTEMVNLAQEFDNTIYPRLTKVYGTEWSPGIDNEKRVTILIAQMREGAGGYFNSADEFFKYQIFNSNEREMIYLNSLYLGTAGVKGYLAHEFHHLINFFQKEKSRGVTEDIWLNEARSEYALTLCGYDSPLTGSHLARRINEFKRNSSEPLAEWQNRVEDYGAVNLFLQYLTNRYGERILTEMVNSESIGITEINEALAKTGNQDRFVDIFTNWVIGNYLNNCQIGDGQRYCYLDQSLSYDQIHVAPGVSSQLSSSTSTIFSFSDRTKDWAGHWYELNAPNGAGLNITINFKGDKAGSFVVPYLINYANGAQTVKFFRLNSAQEANELISNSSNQVKSIILMPFGELKKNKFSSNDPSYNFSFDIRLTAEASISFSPSPSPAPSATPTPTVKPNYPDGSLIRARGDYKVYVISGSYRRWLQSAEIFRAYPHLGWQAVIEVAPSERDWYQEAWLVRAANDYKVYEINGDGTKHWLNITAEQFSVSGRSWGMVFIINQAERDWYRAGASVMK